MEIQVIEGTFAEVKKRLSALPLEPDAHLRIVVSEPGMPPTLEETQLADCPRRNGLILVPTRNPSRSVTVELVKELSED